MLPPKDALIEHPHTPEEWSEQCKWYGKYGLYDRWQPIVEDFYKSYALRKPLNVHYQILIDVLTGVRNSHKEDHKIREFCNKYIEEFRAHNKSLQRGSDMSRYPNVGEAELFYFMKTGYPRVRIYDEPSVEDTGSYLPDKDDFCKFYRNQLIKEYVNRRHNELELIAETIGQLHSDYKAKQINQHLKQISNGLCWYSDDYIKEKYKHLRISSRETV